GEPDRGAPERGGDRGAGPAQRRALPGGAPRTPGAAPQPARAGRLRARRLRVLPAADLLHALRAAGRRGTDAARGPARLPRRVVRVRRVVTDRRRPHLRPPGLRALVPSPRRALRGAAPDARLLLVADLERRSLLADRVDDRAPTAGAAGPGARPRRLVRRIRRAPWAPARGRAPHQDLDRGVPAAGGARVPVGRMAGARARRSPGGTGPAGTRAPR